MFGDQINGFNVEVRCSIGFTRCCFG